MEPEHPESGEGGRPKIPTFGTSRDKLLAFLIVCILANVGWYFSEDEEQNRRTLYSILRDNRRDIGYDYDRESEFDPLYTLVFNMFPFLTRARRGRTPGTNINFPERAAVIHGFLFANIGPDARMEEIFGNAERLNRYIVDNAAMFTAETTHARMFTNFHILESNYDPENQNSLRPVPPRSARIAAAQERISESPLTVTGFAALDARYIPLRSGGHLGGPEPTTETSSPVSTPGFWDALNKAVRSAKLQKALSNFVSTIRHDTRGRFSVCRDEMGGLGNVLVNEGEVRIKKGSVCNYYSGFFSPDDEGPSAVTNPSNRKFRVKMRLLSYWKPEIRNEDGVLVSKRKPPQSVKSVLTTLLIGWGADMVDKFPEAFCGGAEFSEHCCAPNSFVHSAPSPDDEGQFTLSDTFHFPHTIRRNGLRIYYDRFRPSPTQNPCLYTECY
jgi:hypothetical protein